jgi:hypothetical protein
MATTKMSYIFVLSEEQATLLACGIWGFRGSVVEKPGLLEYDAVSLGWFFQTFRKVMPLLSKGSEAQEK